MKREQTTTARIMVYDNDSETGYTLKEKTFPSFNVLDVFNWMKKQDYVSQNGTYEIHGKVYSIGWRNDSDGTHIMYAPPWFEKAL